MKAKGLVNLHPTLRLPWRADATHSCYEPSDPLDVSITLDKKPPFVWLNSKDVNFGVCQLFG